MSDSSGGILVNWNLGGIEDYVEEKQEQQEKVKMGTHEGYVCVKCNEFFPYAEINQNDNTFKCWACRNV
jgi:hypothetical protein